MKRTLIILIVVILYVATVSYALMYLPFADTPALLKSLFTKSWQGTIAWMKIRHIFVVLLIGYLLALFLLHYNKKTAQRDALVIAFLAVTYGVIFRLSNIGFGSWTWVEITDYLTIWVVIPAVVAMINGSSRESGPGVRPN